MKPELDIEHNPLDSQPFIERLVVRSNDIHAFIDSCVFSHIQRQIYAMWFMLGPGSGGVHGAQQLYQILAGGKDLQCNMLLRSQRYDYITRQTTWDVEPSDGFYLLEPVGRNLHRYEQQIASVPQHKIVESAILDTNCMMSSTDSHFYLLFPAEWSRQQRLRYFFDQVSHRCLVPLSILWAEQLWKEMIENGLIRSLESFGRYIGWEVYIDERLLLDFVSRGIRTRFLPLPISLDEELAA